jgi:hypothetical protein
MERVYTVLGRVLLASVFAAAVSLAAARPISIEEATLWAHLVRPPWRESLVASDAWSGLWFATLAKRGIGLFRLSELTLRLPGVLSCAIYLLVLYRKLRRQLWVAVLAAAVPVALGWFSAADGRGVALACCSLAWLNSRFAPLWCGLAVAAFPLFAIPLGLLAIAMSARRGVPFIERMLIPAVVTAFLFLVIPLSHMAASRSEIRIGGREAATVKARLQPLRDLSPGPVRISAVPSARLLVEFYRARYRRRNWQITDDGAAYRIAP